MNSTSCDGVAPNRDGHANSATGASLTPVDTLAPNPTRSARVVPKKAKLSLSLLVPKPSQSTQSKLSAKPSHSKLTKENPHSEKKNAPPPPSAFADEKQEKKRSRLGGSASKLGGLGSLVRQASKGFLKDVTNGRPPSDASNDTSRFVNVGIEDAADDAGDEPVVDIVECVPCEPHTYQTAVDGLDPDIVEVMVVKRSKTRAAIDYQWADVDRTRTGKKRIRDNGVESDVEGGGAQKAKTGWWKRKNEGTKDEARPKVQRRLSALLSPTPKVEDLCTETKEKPESNDGKGSLVIRAIRSARSFNQVSAGDQTVVQEPPVKPSPPEKTLRRTTKATIAIRRPSDPNLSQDMSGVSSPESKPSRLVPSSYRRRIARRHVSQPLPEPKDEAPVGVENVVESAATEPFARPIPRSRPNSALYADNRISIVSILTSEDSQGGYSSSETKKDRRSSTGSNVRWDPEAITQQAKKMRREREERMRQRAQEERERIKNGLPPLEHSDKKQRVLAARRRTPLIAVFDDLDISAVDAVEKRASPQTPPPQVVVDPIVAATEAMLLQSVRSSPPEQSPEKAARSRFRLKEKTDHPRPGGIVPTGDNNDAAIYVLNAANKDLQELLGSADLSSTPDTTPSLPSVTPTARDESTMPTRQVSQSADSQDQGEPQRIPLVRRTSGSGVVSQQVAAWPPAPPLKSPTSPSPIDLPLPIPRQRRHTSSSTITVPPSAFSRKLSLVGDSLPEESLMPRISRSENGNVARKAKFYGELEKGAMMEGEFGLRMRTSNQPKDGTSQRSRSRFSSFPVLEASSGVDIRTDIPDELHDILAQAQPVVVAPIQQVEGPQPKTSEVDESAQEFVYTGVDAVADNTDKEYSVVNEFSSYDEVSKPEIPTMERTPTPQPEDVFAPTKGTHNASDSIVSMESDASVCVVSKPTAPFVLHKPQLIVDSPDQTINDTFAFASKLNPLKAAPKAKGVIRTHHGRTHSVITPASPTPTHQPTGSHDDDFSFAVVTKEPARRPLTGVFTSPTSETDADNSPHPNENTLPDLGPPSTESSASVDSFFDQSHNRSSSSTSSIFTVFGIEQANKQRKGVTSKGNLFGQATRPTSLISSYSNVGVVSDEEGVLEQLELLDETGSKTPVASSSPIKISSAKVDSSPTKPVDTTPMQKKLEEDIPAAVPRPRPRGATPIGSGHHRRRTTLGLSSARPMTFAEAIHAMETYESIHTIESSPRRSANTSSTANASSTLNADRTTNRPFLRSSQVPRHVSCASWHASTDWEDERMVAIANGEPELENNMVLRRYYTFQREAQEALDRSYNEWRDTAFSIDEVTTFQPPTKVGAMEHFLDESRRYYSELPVEWKARARRRAMTAPYPASINAHLEDKPESRSGSGTSSPVDAVFKDPSMWDRRRVRKVSASGKRSRKSSEEGRRSRKTSATMAAPEKERVRKVSEKKKRTNGSQNGGTSNTASMSGRGRAFGPFVEADEEATKPSKPSKNSKTLTVNTTNLSINDLNGSATIGRARATVLAKVALKLQQLEQEQARAEMVEQDQEGKESESDGTGKENGGQDKVLRPRHSLEGMLESPTGSLRIARPRPKRKGLTPTVSPPSTLRL